jgi:hypothetical protein
MAGKLRFPYVSSGLIFQTHPFSIAGLAPDALHRAFSACHATGERSVIDAARLKVLAGARSRRAPLHFVMSGR